jgi:hypothetical protein
MAITFDLDFTLHAQATAVPVRLRRVGERWVAHAGREGRVGLGAGPREALLAAISPLGQTATREMLADLALLEPSVAIVEMERDRPAGA